MKIWLKIAAALLVTLGISGWYIFRILTTVDLPIIFKEGVSYEQARAVIESYGLQVTEPRSYTSQEGFNGGHELTITIPAKSTEEWIGKLTESPDVLYVPYYLPQ